MELITLDGFGPIPLRRPETVEELGEEVRRARKQRESIYPIGGRTHLGLGVPPTRTGLALETLNLNKVIDYPSRDLTITVQAGIRVSELQAILAKENQRLAVDIAHAELATLGGVLAVNASGPRRYGCGTLRDYLIGVSFVNDEGHEIKSGGRVVKNVAGYDMCKLLIGSLGTLGIITQATLKLRPLAETSALVRIDIALEKIDDLLQLVHDSRTRPVSIELINSAATKDTDLADPRNGWFLMVAFEDNEQAVAWQVRTLLEELLSGSFAVSRTWNASSCSMVLEELTEFAVRSYDVFRMRASVPPRSVGHLCREISGREESWQIQAHAANGVLRIWHKLKDLDEERAR